MSFEAASIDRTARSEPLEGSAVLLAATGDAHSPHQGTPCPEAWHYLRGFPPKRATAPFDAGKFDATRCLNQNGGADRCEHGSEQGVCKFSFNLVFFTHSVGDFEAISYNPTASARYLPARKDVCALNEQTPPGTVA